MAPTLRTTLRGKRPLVDTRAQGTHLILQTASSGRPCSQDSLGIQGVKPNEVCAGC